MNLYEGEQIYGEEIVFFKGEQNVRWTNKGEVISSELNIVSLYYKRL